MEPVTSFPDRQRPISDHPDAARRWQNRFSWKNTGQVLADRGFHVVALDARGHGDSDRAPSGQYSIHALARDVTAVLEQIGRPVVIIGASMGGMTGIIAAHRAGPKTVTQLVLVDVVPRYEHAGTARIRDFMTRHVHGFRHPGAGRRRHRRLSPAPAKAAQPQGLQKNLRHREGRWHWHWDPAFVTAAGDEPFVDPDELERLTTQLQIPILLVRGKLSDVVSPRG